MRLTRTAIGLLTRQYRSVLRKCWMINVGLWQAMGDAVSKAVSVPARLVASLLSGGTMNGEAFNALDEILLSRLFERKLASLTAIGLGIAAATMPTEALAEDITSRVVNTGTATYTDDTFTGIISSSLDGGAVYNEKTGTISFNNTGFEGNVGENGGALYNRGRVDSLSGGFSYNHATSRGGAIYQKSAGTMGDITADFTQNYVSSTGIGKGGAIYNGYRVSNITGNFTRNYVNGITDAEGGAIKQSGRYAQAGNIVGNFISNYVIGGTAGGGAMSMDGSVGNISGDFVGNTATSNGNGLSDSARGGAVVNNANITSITGNFTNNLAQATGTYVPETSWYVPEGKKWEDRVEVQIPATVATVSAKGGALVNAGPVSIGEISGSFSGNAAKSTAGNAFGGGIYNDGGTFTNGIVNSSFTDNYAQTDSSSADVSAHGGAIWTNNDLTLKATNGYNMLFSGNYVEKAGVKTPEAIWLELYGDENDKRKCGENGTNCLTLTLNTSNGGTMRFDDQINGDSGYKIQITNDGTGGQVVFNNSIKAEKRYEYGTTAAHADIQLGNKSSLKLGADNLLSGNNLSLAASNTATLDLRNGAAGNTSLKSLTLGNSSKLLLAVDADLRNAVADRLTADSYTWNTGSVMINAISLATLSDADSVNIQLVDPTQTHQYSVDSSIVNDPTLKTYYSTIAYNPGTGVLSLANKTTYAPINLVGSWSNGNYITRYNASDSGATSVGANLKLLDDAIGTWNNEVAGSNLVLYDANNASATGVGANMMRLDRAVVAVKNDLNTVGNNLNVTNNNLANNYYTKENTHAILGQVTSSEVISFSGEFSTTHTVGNAISELDTQIGSFEKIDSASASIEHNTQRAEYITEKATLLENYENEEDFTTKARIKNNYDIHEDTDAYAALTPSEKVVVDNDYTTYSSLADDEAKAPYNFAAENLTELNHINGELNGDYAKDWAVVYHLDDNATVTANLINLDSVIGTWDNGTDGKRTINGHQLTSHLKPYDDTSDETKAETSVGANLVLLDEAILGVEDTLAGFDWLATAATGSAASASMDGTAIGYNSEATKVGSLALGYNAKATGTNGTTAIGSGAQATGAYSTAVGKQAQATVDKATALGNGAAVQSEGSVALGYGSKTGSDTYVVSVGSGIASHSATDQYRRIINVADAVNAHDAVTLGQLQNNYYRKSQVNSDFLSKNVSSTSTNGDIQVDITPASETTPAALSSLTIKDQAVTTAKIADGAVGLTQISADAMQQGTGSYANSKKLTTQGYVDQNLATKVANTQVKNENSITAGDVYDVRYVNSELATKANLSGAAFTGDVSIAGTKNLTLGTSTDNSSLIWNGITATGITKASSETGNVSLATTGYVTGQGYITQDEDNLTHYLVKTVDGLTITNTNGTISVGNIGADKVNAMTSYSKPSSTSAITTSDSLNTAIGKLEYKADDAVKTVKVNNAALTETDGAVNITVATGDASGSLKVNGNDITISAIKDGNVASDAAISLSKLATVTGSRALVSDADGHISASDITATELGYLDNATGNIQSQINAISGDISGAVTTADDAATGIFHKTGDTYDNDGKLIKSGAVRALNATLVHNTGDEEITGTKTFSSQINATNGIKAGANTTLVDGTLTVGNGSTSSTLTHDALSTATVNATTVKVGGVSGASLTGSSTALTSDKKVVSVSGFEVNSSNSLTSGSFKLAGKEVTSIDNTAATTGTNDKVLATMASVNKAITDMDEMSAESGAGADKYTSSVKVVSDNTNKKVLLGVTKGTSSPTLQAGITIDGGTGTVAVTGNETVSGTVTATGKITGNDGLEIKDDNATILTVDATNGVKVANGKALNVGDSGTENATFSINGTGGVTSIASAITAAGSNTALATTSAVTGLVGATTSNNYIYQGQLTNTNTVAAQLDKLDKALGAKLTGTYNIIGATSDTNTINANISALDKAMGGLTGLDGTYLKAYNSSTLEGTIAKNLQSLNNLFGTTANVAAANRYGNINYANFSSSNTISDNLIKLDTNIGDVNYKDETAAPGSYLKKGDASTNTVRGALDALDEAAQTKQDNLYTLDGSDHVAVGSEVKKTVRAAGTSGDVADDAHLVTEKAVRTELDNITTGATKFTGLKLADTSQTATDKVVNKVSADVEGDAYTTKNRTLSTEAYTDKKVSDLDTLTIAQANGAVGTTAANQTRTISEAVNAINEKVYTKTQAEDKFAETSGEANVFSNANTFNNTVTVNKKSADTVTHSTVVDGQSITMKKGENPEIILDGDTGNATFAGTVKIGSANAINGTTASTLDMGANALTNVKSITLTDDATPTAHNATLTATENGLTSDKKVISAYGFEVNNKNSFTDDALKLNNRTVNAIDVDTAATTADKTTLATVSTVKKAITDMDEMSRDVDVGSDTYTSRVAVEDKAVSLGVTKKTGTTTTTLAGVALNGETGTVAITGNETISGTVTATGKITGNDGLEINDNSKTILTADATNGVVIGAAGSGHAQNLTVNGNETVSGTLTANNKLTVTAGGADITGTTELDTLKFAGAATATAIDTTGLARKADGAATTLATTASVKATIANQAADATYIANATDYADNSIGKALQENASKSGVQDTGIKNLYLAVNGGTYNPEDASVTGATTLNNEMFKSKVGDEWKSSSNLTGSLNNLAENITAMTGSSMTNAGAVNNNYTISGVAYGTPAADKSLSQAIGQISNNIGTAITGTIRDKSGATTAAGNSVNQNIQALDTAIGAFEHYTEAQKEDFINARAYKAQRATYVSRKTALETEKAAYPTTHEGVTWDDMEAIIRGKSESERTDAQKALLSKIDELADVTTKLAEGGAYHNENYISPTTEQPVGEEQILYTLKRDADVTQNLVNLDNRLGDFAAIPATNAYVSKDKSVAESLVSLDDAIGTWGGEETSGRYIGKSKNFAGGISVGQALTALDTGLVGFGAMIGSNEGQTVYTIGNTAFSADHTVADDLLALDAVIGDRSPFSGILDKNQTLSQNMINLKTAIEQGGGGGGDLPALTARVIALEGKASTMEGIVGDWHTTTAPNYYTFPNGRIAGRLTHDKLDASLESLDMGLAENTVNLQAMTAKVGQGVVGHKDVSGNITGGTNYIYGTEQKPSAATETVSIAENLYNLDKAIGKITQDGTAAIKATHNASGKPNENVTVASNLVLLDQAVATKINETQALNLIETNAAKGTYSESTEYAAGTIGAAIKAASSGASAEALVGTIKQADGVTTLTVADALGVNSDSHKLVFKDTYGNLAKHAEATPTEPQSVVEAFANLDTNIGKIHGLVTKTATGYMYNATDSAEAGEKTWTNLAVGTTVEEDLLALNKSVGNRNQLITGTNYTNPTGVSDLSVADAVKNLDSGVKTALDQKADEADLADYAQIDGGNYASTTGLYNKIESQITGKGYITKDVSDLANYTKTSDLATVATSGKFADLIEKPTTLAGYGITDAQGKIDADHKLNGAFIQNASITKTQLANGAVEKEQLADNAVTSEKIKDGAITNADISADANIASSKIRFTDAQNTALASGIDSTKVAQITKNANDIDALETWQAGTSIDIANLKTTVGGATSGLVKDMADAKNSITSQGTRLTSAEGKINSLETTVGNSSTGLVKEVADIKSAGYQTADQVEAKITSKGYTTMDAVEAKGYATSAEVNAGLNGKQDEITTSNKLAANLVEGLSEVATGGNLAMEKVTGLDAALAGKQDTISDLDTIRSGAASGATSIQGVKVNGVAQTVTSAHEVLLTADTTATQNSTNLITSGAVYSGLDLKANKADLATVATTGQYSDLIGAPTNVSAFTNDAGYITKDVSDLDNYYTKTNLSTAGGAVINGSNLTDGSVSQAKLDTTLSDKIDSFITKDVGNLTYYTTTADLKDGSKHLEIAAANIKMTNDQQFVSETEKDSWSDKYTKAEVNAFKVSKWENDAGYITKSVDNLDNYYTKAQLNTANGGAVVHGSNLTAGSVGLNKLETTNLSQFTNDAGFITSVVIKSGDTAGTPVEAFRANATNTADGKTATFAVTSDGVKVNGSNVATALDLEGKQNKLTSTSGNAGSGIRITDDGVISVTGIGPDEIADGAITTPKLADGAVTIAKINPEAMTSSEVASGATGDKLVNESSLGATRAAINTAMDNMISATDEGIIQFKTSDGTNETQTYTKVKVDSLLANKVNTSDVLHNYSPTDVLTSDQIYSAIAVRDALATKANLSGAAFTGDVSVAGSLTQGGYDVLTTNSSLAGGKLVDTSVTKAKLAQAVQDSLDLADSALQASDITEGTTAGAISVDGTPVQVHGLATVATSGSYTDLINRPTKVSDFTNDVGYQTASDVANTLGMDAIASGTPYISKNDKVGTNLNALATQLKTTTDDLAKVVSGATPVGKAEQATKDGDGNIITATYLKQAGHTANSVAITNSSGEITFGQVDTAQIADNAIETAQLNDNAVTAGKIADGAVMMSKLGNDVKSTSVAAGDDKLVTSSAVYSYVTTNYYDKSAIDSTVGGINQAINDEAAARRLGDSQLLSSIQSTNQVINDFVASTKPTNGKYVTNGNTVAQNFNALDAAVKGVSDTIGDMSALSGSYVDGTKTVAQNLQSLNDNISSQGQDVRELKEAIKVVDKDDPTKTRGRYVDGANLTIGKNVMELDKAIVNIEDNMIGVVTDGTYVKAADSGQARSVADNLEALDSAIGRTEAGHYVAASTNPDGSLAASVADNMKSIDDQLYAASTALGGGFTTDPTTGEKSWSANVIVPTDATTPGGTYVPEYGNISVTTVTQALEKIKGSIGLGDVLGSTAAGTSTNGVSIENTVNENIAALNGKLGDMTRLNKDLKNLTNGGDTLPSTVVEALNNIDATLGQVHGLADKLREAGSYNGNLANDTLEHHLTNLDAAIGDRSRMNNTSFDNYASLAGKDTASAITSIASNIGKAEDLGQAMNGVSSANTVNKNIASLNEAIGNLSGLQETAYAAQTTNVTDAIKALDANMYRLDYQVNDLDNRYRKLRKEFQTGMASMAAMSALAPNARAYGDTQLSVGTGAYSGHTAAAVGAYHWLTDNLLLNAGMAWGDTSDVIYRMGVTYSW